jgi:DNA-binding GntR family transcriptional regulator
MQGDPAIYERLNAINRDLRQANTLQRWMELDILFHRSLIEASGLSPLMAFSDILAVFFRRFRESVKKGEWSKGIASHQFIIDALRAGNVAEAEARLRTHIESHKQRLGEDKATCGQ